MSGNHPWPPPSKRAGADVRSPIQRLCENYRAMNDWTGHGNETPLSRAAGAEYAALRSRVKELEAALRVTQAHHSRCSPCTVIIAAALHPQATESEEPDEAR